MQNHIKQIVVIAKIQFVYKYATMIYGFASRLEGEAYPNASFFYVDMKIDVEKKTITEC